MGGAGTFFERLARAAKIWWLGYVNYRWHSPYLAWWLAGKCPQCNGAGRYWAHWGPDQYDFDAIDCDRCGGTGKRFPARVL
jgi:hypothetical protein